MNEQQRQEIYRQQYGGMRAMSKEDMEKRSLEQSVGIRNASQDGDRMRGAAHTMNVWGPLKMAGGTMPPLTRWQRLRNWLGA